VSDDSVVEQDDVLRVVLLDVAFDVAVARSLEVVVEDLVRGSLVQGGHRRCM
jgi:hypothetical protein